MKIFSSILLVDDDEISNFIHESLLQEIGAADHIHIFLNGAETLTFIQTHWLSEENTPEDKLPTLMLLDINMPGMDGFQLLKQLETLTHLRNLRVVILTTSQHTKDMKKADVFKVAAYLKKPLTQEKFVSLIKNLKG